RTYLLDMDPASSHNRLEHTEDRMEAAGQEFQKRTRQAFLDLASHEPSRFMVIDAAKSIEEVWNQIRGDADGLLAR
ncbi:MAG: dTMP kinase, partial [Bifidobacterium sp.]|nr:dTMP kinase [Bifidobacterium sp.]